MKKYIALILALITVFALCACGESEDTDDGGNAQMVNPMVEVTPEELKSTIGVALTPPEGANDTMYFVIGGNLGEVQFKYGKTNEKYSYRVQKTDALQDISGVYLSDPITPEDLENAYSLAKCDGEYCVALWYVDGYSYSVSCATDDHELIETMRSLLGG